MLPGARLTFTLTSHNLWIEATPSCARLGKAGQRHNGKLALVKLENAGKCADTYLAGIDNFYVITRYNWSSYYAMAVIELAEAVAREVQNSR